MVKGDKGLGKLVDELLDLSQFIGEREQDLRIWPGLPYQLSTRIVP